LLPNQSQNSQNATSANSSNPIAADFKTLGEALQSGNLSSAQSAFSRLQNDLKAGSQGASSNVSSGLAKGARHHHHHHAPSTQDSDSSSLSTEASTSTSSSYGPGSTSQSSGSGSPPSAGQILNILA